MTFSYGQIRKMSVSRGDRAQVTGWYNNDSDSSGGAINTGLKAVEYMTLNSGSANGLIAPTAPGSTYPVDGSSITVTTGKNDHGTWKAEGF